MPWRTLHPTGAASFIVDGNFIERRIPTPYQLRSASGYIYQVLLSGETFQISNARPCIRTLARWIRAVGYLVDVYLFPNNTFESIPPDVLRYIVRIGDTVLIIIPPEALASEYRSDYYADSDSTSTTSGDSSLHLWNAPHKSSPPRARSGFLWRILTSQCWFVLRHTVQYWWHQ